MFRKIREMFGGAAKKEQLANHDALIKQFMAGVWGPLELCKQLKPGQGEAFTEAFEAM
jgi:hypothetical protein